MDHEKPDVYRVPLDAVRQIGRILKMVPRIDRPVEDQILCSGTSILFNISGETAVFDLPVSQAFRCGHRNHRIRHSSVVPVHEFPSQVWWDRHICVAGYLGSWDEHPDEQMPAPRHSLAGAGCAPCGLCHDELVSCLGGEGPRHDGNARRPGGPV